MNELEEIQQWYLKQCNGDWEHSYGLSIENLDNPGWSLKIDLVGTGLENVAYAEYSYGVDKDSHPITNDWVVTKVSRNQFLGFGGPEKLQELLSKFLIWANNNS